MAFVLIYLVSLGGDRYTLYRGGHSAKMGLSFFSVYVHVFILFYCVE